MNSTIIIHTENKEQENALKAFAKALKIKFEVSKESPYDPEFVEKIVQGDKDIDQGKGRKVTLDELNSLWK